MSSGGGRKKGNSSLAIAMCKRFLTPSSNTTPPDSGSDHNGIVRAYKSADPGPTTTFDPGFHRCIAYR